MKKHIKVLSVGFVFLFISFVLTPFFSVQAISPEYEYFDSLLKYVNVTSDPTAVHVLLYPKTWDYLHFGENLPIKYIVRSPYNYASNLVMKVYVIPEKPGLNSQDAYFTYENATLDNGMSWNCGILKSKIPKIAKLVYTKGLSDIAMGEYVTGQFSIKINKSNGFIENKAPSVLGSPKNLVSLIVATVEDRDGHFYPFEMKQKGIKTICSHVITAGVVNKGTLKTDLAVSKFVASQTQLTADEFFNDKPIKFTATIKNVGIKTTHEARLCLRKQNPGLESPIFSSFIIGDEELPDGIASKVCKTVPSIKPSKSLAFDFVFNSRSDKFKIAPIFYSFDDKNVEMEEGQNTISAVLTTLAIEDTEITTENNIKKLLVNIE